MMQLFLGSKWICAGHREAVIDSIRCHDYLHSYNKGVFNDVYQRAADII